MTASGDSFLIGIQNAVNFVAAYLHKANFFLGCISLFVNVLHLIVLTRKSMRTTSTNMIMIGIAISDISTMINTIYKHYMLVDIENPECVASTQFFKVYMDLAAWSLQEHFRRCSAWLGVLMASVRVIVIRNPTDKKNVKYSKPPFGWSLTVCVFCVSGLLSGFFMSRFEVVSERTTPLPVICAEFQDIFHPPPFTLSLTSFFSFENQLVLRIYLMFNAIVTKFIPCISFPILTVILLKELRKVVKKTSVSAKKSNAHNDEKNQLTTKLIIFMTCAFFIAEGPLGILNLIQVFYNRDDRMLLLSVDIVIFFTVLLTLNSISHFLFCTLMSSQYRDTIRRILGLHNSKSGKSSARNKTSVVSVQGLQNP